ncbi:MAG: MerR family DNA-binding protein [Cellvibrio sp.]|uniref:MerR family DNA-binding protein n=1 Tax=Cellvibrio sp. TaxID=1965322 RepID=UPI0031A7471D
MNISQAAQACGLPNKTIRYYEDIGLVVPKRQQANDYRIYSLDDVAQLRFLQRARAVGFSLDECRELLALQANPQRRCVQVKALVSEKITQVDQQLIALHAMRDTLVGMANECAGDETSDCAIINQLAVVETPSIKKPSAMSFTLIDAPDEAAWNDRT